MLLSLLRDAASSGDSKMERRGVPPDQDSLVFFGQGEFAAFADGSDPSADERIKSYLDPSLVAQRRRVVRRPLGSGYQAQTIVFSERDRDAAPSLASSEPLSELLQQLAASRKSMLEGVPSRPARAVGSGGASASVLSSLGLDGSERKRTASEMSSAVAASPTDQLRACFVQELMLSALSAPSTTSTTT
jgi:hypothetical protein